MNTKQTSILTILLLIVVIAGGSACSLTKTNAQTPTNQTESSPRTEIADSTTPAYKPPKRISKDIIKSSEKTEKKKEEQGNAKRKSAK